MIAAFASCSDAKDRIAVDDGCRWPAAADTAGWAVVDAGPFVFKVPPAYREQLAAGAESYLGTFVAGDRAIAFDYGGRTTDPRERPGAGGEWSCATVLAGAPAVVWSGGRIIDAGGGRTVRHETAEGWWESVGEDSVRLFVIGWGPQGDTAAVREALTAIRTIKLRTVFTPADSVRQLHRFCETLRLQAERSPEYGGAYDEWRPRCPTGPAPPPPDYESVR